MKKNLRIVSAAAAALLAVAPVAATAVASAPTSTVQAADTKTVKVTKNTSVWEKTPAGNFVELSTYTINKDTVLTVATKAVANGASGDLYEITSGNMKGYYVKASDATDTQSVPATPLTPAKPVNKPTDNGSTSINAGASSIFRADANTAVNITAVAKTNVAPSTLTGNIVATIDGKQVTATLHNLKDNNNVHVYTYTKLKSVDASNMTAGHYWASFDDVTVNAGASYAGKTETFVLNKGEFVKSANANHKGTDTIKVTANPNGVFDLGPVLVDFYAYNANDLKEVHFYDTTTGNIVTNGSVNLHAVNGKLNVSAVYSALAGKYVASQLLNGQGIDQLLPLNDFRDQLKKQNIDVDANGYFTAPASFNLNFNAKSNDNGATASLPVTVTVDNATASNNAQETTKTVKIMHISTIYDKNGKATHDAALRAYNTVSVVSDPVTLKDENGKDAGRFYKLAGQDRYIKVGNVDGTSRSLKHNSYVYKSTGKRRGKTVLKKGSSVTTYGKSFMIAGHQMYRINENQYVKKANF